MTENPDDLAVEEEEQGGERRLGEDIAAKGRRLFELREKRDADKKKAEVSEAEFREAEQDFFMQWENSPLQGAMKIDLGGSIGEVSFSPRETYFGRILDSDKAQTYFEQRAMVDEMFQPKIAKKRLNEFVRECLDNGTPLPDGVDFYAQRGITITRQKG